MYQPAYQPPMHRPMSEMMRGFVSDTILALGVLLGLLVTWIGALIWGFSNDPDVQDIGMLFRSFGVLILSGGMLLGGILRQDLDKSLRWGLILGGVIVLVAIGFWSLFWWMPNH
jgi:zinc transporter ZupT